LRTSALRCDEDLDVNEGEPSQRVGNTNLCQLAAVDEASNRALTYGKKLSDVSSRE
jgi:hypothetical protein